MMSEPYDVGRESESECPCGSCAGSGWIDIGDCEDGVIDECPECHGTGIARYY
jgi:DnaJ-class molecular chaperone